MTIIKKEITAKDYGEHASLARAVWRQMGGKEVFLSYYKDINNHGMANGFTGFIYYSETTAFYRAQRKRILKALQEKADGLGEGVMEMISGFHGWKNTCLKTRDVYDTLGRVLYGQYGDMEDYHIVANLLTWWAVEYIARLTEMFYETKEH